MMKRFFANVLCLTMLSTLILPASAADLKSFSDVPAGRWSHDAIMEMVDLGMFKGTKDPDENGVGEFTPAGTMTKAQFLVVATRHLFQEALNQMEPGENWYANNYEVAVAEGMIKENEFPYDALNTPITRQEMALIAVRTAELQGEKIPALVKPGRIADYNTIGSYYKDFVLAAFTMGLITGYDDKGTFGPTDTLTREQGAMVAYRLVREEVREYPVEEPSVPENNDGPMTIYEGQPSSRPAKAGDTYVKADGTSVVLKVGPNGVLGEGQGVAPDANLSVATGTTASSNFNKNDVFTYDRTKIGVLTDSLGKDLMNQKYMVNATTGEGHWGNEWNAIRKNYPAPQANGTYEGQVSSDPYSLYVWDGMVGWIFNGK